MIVELARILKLGSAQSLCLTTASGDRFTVVERDGSLYITSSQKMFVQWDGEQAVQLFQLRQDPDEHQ